MTTAKITDKEMGLESLARMLQEKFVEAQVRNPSYSLRSYAKKLGISPGALCEIMKGKRAVSLKLLERLADRLLLGPVEREGLFSKGLKLKANKKSARGKKVKALSLDHFHLISEWYHFALLSLMKVEGFVLDKEWISLKLGLSKKTVTESLERMVSLELLELDWKKKTWKVLENHLETPPDTLSLSLRKSHSLNIDLARKALEEVEVSERDFNSLILTCHPEKMPLLKQKVSKFLNEVSDLLETEEATDVYMMNVQFFPLTKNAH